MGRGGGRGASRGDARERRHDGVELGGVARAAVVRRASEPQTIHPPVKSSRLKKNSHSTRTPTCPIRVSRFTRARGRDCGIKTPEDRSDCERCLVTRGSNESGL